MKKLIFKLFPNDSDVNLIKVALNQLTSDFVDYTIMYTDDFNLAANEVAVIFIKSLDDSIIQPLIKARKSKDNQFIILTDSENIILPTTLSRLGLRYQFIIPHELQKFKTHLRDYIDNNLYRVTYEKKGSANEYDFDNIIGNSDKMAKVKELSQKIAENQHINALLLGETGTGKDLIARTIHENSPKANFPFIDIICTAIPPSLLEAELFGYEKGAFTDARERKKGLFELAEEGTIFLDEIGDLSLDLQAKLLKAIDKRIIRRLGGTKDIKINARIISATNKDLKTLVDENRFRQDLFFRLNVISVMVPPLRERGDDVLLIADHFIKQFSRSLQKDIKVIEHKLLQYLKNYEWPGNIRELKNAIERAVLLSDDNTLRLQHLFNVLEKRLVEKNIEKKINLEISAKSTGLRDLNKKYADEVLKRLNGNKKKTAQILGITRPTLDSLLK